MSQNDSNIFNEGRFTVLKVLGRSGSGVSLREIAYRSGLSIGAVQAAIRSLLRSKTVCRSKSGNRIIYRLNPQHEDLDVILTTLNALSVNKIKRHAAVDSQANRSLLTALMDLLLFSNALRQAARES